MVYAHSEKESFSFKLRDAEIKGYRWENKGKPVVISFPGGFCSSSMDFLDYLAQDYDVWCPHPRGIGRGKTRSFAKDGKNCIEDHIRDMDELIPLIFESTGKKMHFVGYSAGGWLSRSFACGIAYDHQNQTFFQSKDLADERAEKYIQSITFLSSPQHMPKDLPYPFSLLVEGIKTLGPDTMKYPLFWPNEEDFQKRNIGNLFWRLADKASAKMLHTIDFNRKMFGKHGKNITAKDVETMRSIFSPAEKDYALDCVRLCREGKISSKEGFLFADTLDFRFPSLIVAGSLDMVTEEMTEGYVKSFVDPSQVWLRTIEGAGHFSLVQNFGSAKELALLLHSFMSNPYDLGFPVGKK